MSEGKKDCFAYCKDTGECRILSETICKNKDECRFYKRNIRDIAGRKTEKK